VLRRELGGFELGRTLGAVALMLLGAVLLAATAYGGWWAFDGLFGRSFVAQVLSVGFGLATGAAAYAAVVLGLGIPEAKQVLGLFASRARRRS
jgi:putative peptidoglycan lipid II flippase